MNQILSIDNILSDFIYFVYVSSHLVLLSLFFLVWIANNWSHLDQQNLVFQSLSPFWSYKFGVPFSVLFVIHARLANRCALSCHPSLGFPFLSPKSTVPLCVPFSVTQVWCVIWCALRCALSCLPSLAFHLLSSESGVPFGVPFLVSKVWCAM